MALPERWQIEGQYRDQGYQRICGADEAGAGPLAGDLYAAAVMLPFGLELEGLNDSKQVSAKKREVLFDIIQQEAVAFAIATVDVATIEEINILNARMLAMERAIGMLNPKPDFSLIDGNKSKGITHPNQTIIKGDSLSANIGAASILAKVSRDRYMLQLAEQYPQYQFHRHMGYGTKLHYEMLDTYGPCPAHRPTFLRKWQARRES